MFGIDLWDASLAPALLVAATAGVLSFLSPCVLPIVPPYLAFMAGASLDEATDRRRPQLLGTAAFFVLGLSTVFLLMGLAASAIGRVILGYQAELALAAGVVIVVFGLNFLGLLRLPFLAREMRFETRAGAGTAVGAYLFGLAFAFGWTPCIGPILAAILSVVESCRRLGVPVKEYLTASLPGLNRRTLSEVAHLTPARWVPTPKRRVWIPLSPTK
jgi:cytochrome c-type biogenesis protein